MGGCLTLPSATVSASRSTPQCSAARAIRRTRAAAAAGHTVVTWTRRAMDGIPTSPRKIVRRLAPSSRPGDILLLHDGHCALDAQGRPVVLSVLPALLAELQRQGLVPVTLTQSFSAVRSTA